MAEWGMRNGMMGLLRSIAFLAETQLFHQTCSRRSHFAAVCSCRAAHCSACHLKSTNLTLQRARIPYPCLTGGACCYFITLLLQLLVGKDTQRKPARQQSTRAVRKVVCAARELRSRGWSRRGIGVMPAVNHCDGELRVPSRRCVSLRFISFIRCADAAAAFSTRKAIQHRTVMLLSGRRCGGGNSGCCHELRCGQRQRGPPSEASPK